MTEDLEIQKQKIKLNPTILKFNEMSIWVGGILQAGCFLFHLGNACFYFCCGTFQIVENGFVSIAVLQILILLVTKPVESVR